jgi:alcohol dehydrogenase class IV
MGVRSLRALGVTEADLPVVSEKGAAASSMKGNPIVLTEDEREEILRAAL